MPTVTTEQEIFSCLSENLRLAAEDCEKLAWDPRRGWTYNRFRKSLKLVEGAAQQAYYWRNYDARWLQLRFLTAGVHKRAGHWLRNTPTKDARDQAHPIFAKLAETLRAAHYHAERVRTAATGKLGPILPPELPGPHREVRPVQVLLPGGPRVTPGGIILPN